MVCCYSSNRNLLLTDGASAIWSPATHGGNFLVTQLSLAVPSLPHLPMPSRASQDHLPVTASVSTACLRACIWGTADTSCV